MKKCDGLWRTLILESVYIKLKMVYYCCVNGCNNNSKKRDPNHVISYHTFPSNADVKQKWLRAIGRPNWEPPSYTRICSDHFDQELINHDSHRTRLKDDACPIYNLPPNSNFEASDMEVCRICLDTDSKQYSLQNGLLKDCLESINGLNDKYNIEGLPQYVCYVCAGQLLKCYRLVQRSLTVQATLLDIFAQHGQITKSLIRKQDREQLNLKSPLVPHTTTPTYLFEFKYDHEENCSQLTNNEFITESLVQKTEIRNNELDINSEFKEFVELNVKDEIKREVKCEYSDIGNDDDNDEDYIRNDESNSDAVSDDICLAKLSDKKYKNNISDSEIFVKEICIDKGKKTDKSENKSKRKSTRVTPDELSLQEHFNIVNLSLQEQIEDWHKLIEDRPWKKASKGIVYTCEICRKIFAHVTTYHGHLKCHDPSRGDFECSVCKLRFKSESLMRTHIKRTHSKKYYCKVCPKVINNVNMAKKHQKRHSGHVYSCTRCAFSTRHASCLSAHAQRQHAHALACARCGRACLSRRSLRQHWAVAHGDLSEPDSSSNSNSYRCEECELQFSSEGARRVHLLTSVQHRKKGDAGVAAPDPSLNKTCKSCGLEFPTKQELLAHCREQHPRYKYKKVWRQPGDSYPTNCEFCGESVKSRWEHWWHVRRRHPTLSSGYRRVYTAVCHSCGKGFQSQTKLRLHELRHSPPRVACDTCGRLFYDKYAMLRHAATHDDTRPHQCAHCPRAFKVKGNLQRHAVVHTGATPFECTMCDKKFKHATSLTVHVRTVHYKLPPPPRKKRGPRRTRNKNEMNSDM
ncbi:zinc finger protein 37-like isoform X2 [Plodia interpunctella]|uniref:zinc finger protein 37-like isoform X2 n=1 Tax=Plodia interpunctella TaxID=58824 RepID=UPI002368593F|nr:zinc finger protein 37-like isoform X2 [Plodia interpunctella]